MAEAIVRIANQTPGEGCAREGRTGRAVDAA
jgi:hypothetical protein